MQTYLFYDIESTGLNKAFDQVLHFAAIRTDLSLKELKRYELKIKLNPDIIPSPAALLTHKMGIHEILKEGIGEFEAITKIHQWLNEPGTISLGYNTLGFDDEFLRFSFYRNLLKPYTHQFANRCGRMDIFPMTVMFFLFKKNSLTWPEKEGQVSLKLEDINTANQFSQGNAHNAMTDVEITLALAKRLWQEKEMWQYLSGYFKKEIDHERMQPLQQDIALLISNKLGKKNSFQSPVLFLGNHCRYKKSVWLRLDTETLTETALDSIPEKTESIHKKTGEPNFILPMKERFLTHLNPDRLKKAEENKAWLAKHPDIFAAIKHYHLNYLYPSFPNVDMEASLYTKDFFTPEEELFCRRFHEASTHEKIRLAEHTQNIRLHTLALRILGKNYRDALPKKLLEQFAEYLTFLNTTDEEKIPIDYKGQKRLTKTGVMNEIALLESTSNLGIKENQLLQELRDYIL